MTRLTITLLSFFKLLGFPILMKGQSLSSIYQYTATSIEGTEIQFESFRGKKILIVNTASQCGLTPQFKALQELYDAYKDKGLLIIGFPSNDFAKQDPGTNVEIKSFCQQNYGVSFLMMEKISVKGANIHPIYKWLTKKSENGLMDSRMRWNFQKYLIDENGHLVDKVAPWRKPNCRKILKWLR